MHNIYVIGKRGIWLARFNRLWAENSEPFAVSYQGEKTGSFWFIPGCIDPSCND